MSCPCSCASCCCCGPVFIIIRFPLSRALACKNSLQKHMSVHHNYSGIVSGIAHQMCLAGGCWPCNKGIAILSFETLREAELWKDSVPEIRQQDWLDGVDMIIVPVQLIPPSHKRFVELLDLRFQDIGSYLTSVMDEVAKLPDAMEACRCCVSSCCIRHVKGLWKPHHLVLNFWPSEEAYCKGSKPLNDALACTYGCCEIHSVGFYLHPIVNPICGDCCCP